MRPPMQNDTHDKDDLEDADFWEDVRLTAYFLWEQDGCPHSLHEQYWLRAIDIHRRRRDYETLLEDGPRDA